MNGRRHSAFTLIELIVVMTIIVGLLALALPVLFSMNKKARAAKQRADMTAIVLALNAYQTDHGSYPTPQHASPTPPPPVPINSILVRALVSPGPAGPTSGALPADADGADGFGFRTRRVVGVDSQNNPVLQGKVYGPYVDPNKFKFDLATGSILDDWGHPIEYFVRYRKRTASATPPLMGFSNDGTAANRSAFDWRDGASQASVAAWLPDNGADGNAFVLFSQGVDEVAGTKDDIFVVP